MSTLTNTLTDLSRRLNTGEARARDLTERCLEAIADPAGEGERAFLTVYGDAARAHADWVDRARAAGWPLPPFAGIPISIKDLFDVAGEVTRAGSRVRDGEPPAKRDATLVHRLRGAGFTIVGKTNMTEFAYSGLGMNAHFGTPKSPYERDVGRIPGGSTSGGAVSVADGMAAATIGSDTGGSCRIPAAFCGIVGFKPTTGRVPGDGAFPLSKSLDTPGPLANTVSCCAILDSILTGGVGDDVAVRPVDDLRFGVPTNYVVSRLDDSVAAAYEAALARLAEAGARLTRLEFPELTELPAINAKGGLVGAEAYAVHRSTLEDRSHLYDPWILDRFDAGKSQSAADYIDVQDRRARFRARFSDITAGFDALIVPTVQVIPPTIDELADPEAANAANALILRNTAMGNFVDWPSVSVPCHAPGAAPAGLMIMAETGRDRTVLAIARGVEAVLQPNQQK